MNDNPRFPLVPTAIAIGVATACISTPRSPSAPRGWRSSSSPQGDALRTSRMCRCTSRRSARRTCARAWPRASRTTLGTSRACLSAPPGRGRRPSSSAAPSPSQAASTRSARPRSTSTKSRSLGMARMRTCASMTSSASKRFQVPSRPCTAPALSPARSRSSPTSPTRASTAVPSCSKAAS